MRPRINIVLDIDETIATGLLNGGLLSPWANVFSQYGLLIDAVKPHVIHLGVVEFLQMIDSMMPEVTLSFFSAGKEKRNLLLVKQLLSLALGQERYHQIKSEINIFSGDHHIDPKVNELEEAQWIYYGIDEIGNKKNLTKVTDNAEELAWAVLIEDNMGCAFYGQEKNILRIPAATAKDFSTVFNDEKSENLNDFLQHRWDEFARINHIFYMTGLLLSSIEIAEKENKTLADVLFKTQFIEDINGTGYLKYDERLIGDMTYFDLGLKKLREFNPDLNFSTPDNFLSKPNIKLKTDLIKNVPLIAEFKDFRLSSNPFTQFGNSNKGEEEHKSTDKTVQLNL